LKFRQKTLDEVNKIIFDQIIIGKKDLIQSHCDRRDKHIKIEKTKEGWKFIFGHA